MHACSFTLNPSHSTTYHHLPTNTYHYTLLQGLFVQVGSRVRYGQSVWMDSCALLRILPNETVLSQLTQQPTYHTHTNTKHTNQAPYIHSPHQLDHTQWAWFVPSATPTPPIHISGSIQAPLQFSYMYTSTKSSLLEYSIPKQAFQLLFWQKLLGSHEQYNTQLSTTRDIENPPQLTLWQLGLGIHNMTCAQPW